MRVLTAILLLLSVSWSALAVPNKAPPTTAPYVKLEKPRVPPWTIKSFTRECNDEQTNDTSCAISFWIDTNTPGEPPAYCYFIIASANAVINKIPCGKYWRIGSSWSPGSGRPGQGVTTLSLYHKMHGLIAWPKFYDYEIVNGIHATKDRNIVPDWY